MSLRSHLRADPATAWWLGAAVAVAAAVAVVVAVDVGELGMVVSGVGRAPVGAVLALVAYAAAFALRSLAWVRLVPGLPLGQAAAAIHVSLAGNHVLPLRLGEVLRVTSVVRRTDLATAAAAASTVTLRAADVAAVVGLALLTGPAVVAELTGGWGWALLPVSIAVLVAGAVWAQRSGRAGGVRLPGPLVLAATTLAWVLEAAVVHAVAGWAGVALTAPEAVLVTAVTIAAQTVAIAPGGFGTYEAAQTAALVSLGVDARTGLAIALTTHAAKTLYALVAGAVAVSTPRPSLIGHLRVPRSVRPRPPAVPVVPDGPVVLFMPAHDEAACVGDVLARVPDRVLGHRVELVVVDDGSTDATAAIAAAGGADVVALGANHGLGAAVRRGLAEGVARQAAAVVFCDADGEYAPEELERLVAPVLAGTADYVVGSRFDGEITRMLPHRRFGNRVLTHLVRFLTRLPVNDGQSGYRALSPAAARAAEVAHDFNYAQVLTLDLVAKGFRYAEVPISYRFRETGESFVRLGPYLRSVLPALWRELNGRATAPTAGDLAAELARPLVGAGQASSARSR